MIDLYQWRATIGLWSCCLVSSSGTLKRECKTRKNSCLMTLSLINFFLFLIILSGNVELNPGPDPPTGTCM